MPGKCDTEQAGKQERVVNKTATAFLRSKWRYEGRAGMDRVIRDIQSMNAFQRPSDRN